MDVLGVQVKRAHVQFTCSAQDRSRIVNRQVLELQPLRLSLSPLVRSALAVAAAAPFLLPRAHSSRLADLALAITSACFSFYINVPYFHYIVDCIT